MAWDESRTWLSGTGNQPLYRQMLDDAAARPQRDASRKKVITPQEMPWELARQGILKHLLNAGMNTRMETVDAYLQILPPGSRSGRHRHLAEECLYVLEGYGYDLHRDCNLEITDKYHWVPDKETRRFDWEAGDVIYVPPNTIHQHFNGDPDQPARLVSATNRIFKYCGLNDLEQLEDAPEYEDGVELTAEAVRALLAGEPGALSG